MPRLRRIFSFFTALAILTSASTCRASTPQTSASAYILMDADSGRILAEQGSERELAIASTTKIMTALVALDYGALTERVCVKREHLKEGSSMYLAEGETLTREALLYGLLLPSGNDAAECIADTCGGREAFVARMNEKAAALGMAHSAFANPSGLDAQGHYSCAEDMARLAVYAMQNPMFARIVSTVTATVGTRTMGNHNKLLTRLDGCIGLKTGYTDQAGRTLVTCCERDARRLVAVTLHDRDDWADHTALYEYGFANFTEQTAVKQGAVCGYVAVSGAQRENVALIAADGFAYPLAEGEILETEKVLPDMLTAPIRAGTPAGELIVRLNGEELGRVALVCASDIGKEEKTLGFWQRLFGQKPMGE